MQPLFCYEMPRPCREQVIAAFEASDEWNFYYQFTLVLVITCKALAATNNDHR